MAYLDVITLDQAKTYLRVDDTLTEDDAQISSIIQASLVYIENYTDNLVTARSENFLFVNNLVKVYKYPINSLVSPDVDDISSEEFTTFVNYCYTGNDENVNKLVLNVGYADPNDVPKDLRQVAFEIIDIMYYGAETGKKLSDLSELSKSILDRYKRFIF